VRERCRAKRGGEGVAMVAEGDERPEAIAKGRAIC